MWRTLLLALLKHTATTSTHAKRIDSTKPLMRKISGSELVENGASGGGAGGADGILRTAILFTAQTRVAEAPAAACQTKARRRLT